jgi:hypothetical protein
MQSIFFQYVLNKDVFVNDKINYLLYMDVIKLLNDHFSIFKKKNKINENIKNKNYTVTIWNGRQFFNGDGENSFSWRIE